MINIAESTEKRKESSRINTVTVARQREHCDRLDYDDRLSSMNASPDSVGQAVRNPRISFP